MFIINMDAKKVSPWKVLSDFVSQVWTTKKKCLFGFLGVALLITLIIMYFGNINYCVLKDIASANIALLGIDIAAFAILFSALHDKELEEKARKAFDEQSIAFLVNAVFQLMAILLSITNTVFVSSFVFWPSLFIQTFALINVFDIIVELYTLTSLISKKRQ